MSYKKTKCSSKEKKLFSFADIRLNGLKRSSEQTSKQEKRAKISTLPTEDEDSNNTVQHLSTSAENKAKVEQAEISKVNKKSRKKQRSSVDACVASNDTEKTNETSSKITPVSNHDIEKLQNPRSWKSISYDEDTRISYVGIKSSCEGLVLRGQYGVKSLKGGCFINGRIVTPQEKDFLFIHSPNGNRAFTIFPITDDEQNEESQNQEHMKYLESLSDYDVVLLIKGFAEQKDFVQYPGYLGIYKMDEENTIPICDGVWYSKTTWYHRQDYGYESACTEIVNSPDQKNLVVLSCGGKDVGKSSFNRFAINMMLKRHEFVYYLECDVGQTEFTAPGFISLNRVDQSQSLLSPPFEHLSSPLFSVFFGDISPGNNPTTYVETVKKVWKFFKSLPESDKSAIFINTMGWIRGLGLNLLTDVIRITKPSHVVQIQTTNLANRNMETFLTSANLYSMSGWLTSAHDDYFEFQSLNVNVQINSDNKRSTYTAADMRNLALFSYFSKKQLEDAKKSVSSSYKTSWKGGRFVDNLLSSRTYIIHLDDVQVFVAKRESILKKHSLFAVLNSAVVGLSHYEGKDTTNKGKYIENAPICQSFGCGIVRGVDHQSRLIYIISPISGEEISKVNSLILSEYSLPDSFQLDQAKECRASGDVPYVSRSFPNEITGAEQLRQRQYRSLK